MKVGLQTIIWGPQIEDIDYVLDVRSLKKSSAQSATENRVSAV